MSTQIIHPAWAKPKQEAAQDTDEKRLWFAYSLPILLGLLLALIPIAGKLAAIPFMLVLIPLILWTAFSDTEWAIYLYIAWCWMDGSLRGLLGGGPVAVLARDIVFGVIVLGWGMRRLQSRDKDPLRVPSVTLLIILFMVNAVLEIGNPFSLGLLQSLGGLKVQFSPIPLFFVSYDVFRRRGQLRSLFLFLTLMTLAIALVSLTQYLHGKDWTFAHYPGAKEAMSTSFHSDSGARLTKDSSFKPPGTTTFGGATAAFVGLAFPFTFALALLSDKLRFTPFVRTGFFVALLIFTVAIFVNGERSALVEAAVCTVACSIFVGGRLRVRALIAVAVCVGIGLVGLVYSESISQGGVADRFSTTFANPNQALHQDRRSFFEDLPFLVTHSPMGVGLGRTGAVAGHFGTQHQDIGFVAFSEANFGTLILETGLIGAVLIALIALSILKQGYQILRHQKNSDDKFLTASIFGVLFIMFINFFYVSVLVAPPGSVLFWMLSAGLLRVYAKPSTARPKPALIGAIE